MSCAHEKFSAKVDINRLRKNDEEEVTQFMAEIAVKCRDCKTPFFFVDVPIGASPRQIRASVDGTELRAPIAPIGSTPDLDGPGFSAIVYTEDGFNHD